jgi:glycosyltransferase involved in cell wall biosynthesis/SAM-dependent methyltransferase
VRILVVADVSPLFLVGGGERVLWELAARLGRRGHRVRILSRGPAGAPPAVIHHGVPLRHFPVDRRSLVAFVRSSITAARRAVEEELAAHGADVLHLHQPLSALGALGAPGGRRLPSLYTFHSPAPLEYRLRRGSSQRHPGGIRGAAAAAVLWAIERTCLARATRVHVLSEYSAGVLRRLYGVGEERIARIPGGVDLERFRPVPDRAALRRALGVPADRPLLLTVRNLERRMGLDTLLEALDRARRRRPRMLLLVGGAGSLRAELESRAAALGLDGHVRFLGFVPEPELPGYYAAADAFVLPTRALEGFGLVAIEALACGTPVLGTPVGAIPEILRPLAPSLIFPDATAAGIAEGLDRFFTDLERDRPGAERLREACRRHAERRYAWEGVVEDVEAVLAALARGPAGARCPACGGAPGSARRYGGQPYRLCPGCGTATRLTPPDPDHLRRYYDREYPATFAPERITATRRDVLAGLVGRLERLTGSRRLLDLGCGGGHLLAEATDRGWRAVGTDVSGEACAAARKAGGAAVVQADGTGLPLRDGAVEAATLVNVLDHLADPARAVAEAHRVLAPGGVLAVRVPNGAFHRLGFRLAPLGRWAGLHVYPVLHVHAFTARGLRSLVEAAGFEVLEVRNSTPAAEGPAKGDARPHPALHRARGLVGAAARALEVLSGGRWLLGPSLELYARRPSGAAAGPPAAAPSAIGASDHC